MLSSLQLILSFNSRMVLNFEKTLARVIIPFRKIDPVRPLINTIDTFDSSACHDEPRGTSNQYPKRPIHRPVSLVTVIYMQFLPQCSIPDSAYLDELFTWKI